MVGGSEVWRVSVLLKCGKQETCVWEECDGPTECLALGGKEAPGAPGAARRGRANPV